MDEATANDVIMAARAHWFDDEPAGDEPTADEPKADEPAGDEPAVDDTDKDDADKQATAGEEAHHD